MTKKYTGDVDPQQIGKTLSVSNVITGDYRNAGGRLALSVESIDVGNDAVLWRDSIDVPGEDLIAMRNELSSRIRSGLFPRLNIADARAESRPKNDEAYSLYLQAVAMPTDPGPNKQAIAILDRAVHLDPTFAPAWSLLGHRMYFDGQYSDGGMAAITRAEEYHRKALSIDPDLISSRRGLIIHLTERGELTSAYQQARALVAQRPDSGDAHFAVSYVLRYAGLLDEAARECEAARAKDPSNPSLRSCGLVYAMLGNNARAMDFARLDGDSLWVRTFRGQLLLNDGKIEEAVRETKSLTDDPSWRAPALMVEHAPSAEIDPIVAQAKKTAMSLRDGEPPFWTASGFAVMHRNREALELLRDAVDKGYCAYPAVDRLHAFDSVRNTAEFRQIRQAAAQCQQRFLQWRAANAP